MWLNDFEYVHQNRLVGIAGNAYALGVSVAEGHDYELFRAVDAVADAVDIHALAGLEHRIDVRVHPLALAVGFGDGIVRRD